MYQGFPYRTELIKKNIPLGKEKTALEIGIGMAHCTLALSKKFKEIYGFDISDDLVCFLKERIKKGNVHFDAVDACGEIREEYRGLFDVVFSADTLEHVENPPQFFQGISSLLKETGKAVIFFPNESQENHHGITWFDHQEDLLKIIPPQLKVVKLVEVKNTKYFNFIRDYLWDGPKVLMKKIISLKSLLKKTAKPQIFEHTQAFSLNKKHPFLAGLLAIYPTILIQLTKLNLKFIYDELKSPKINDKYLFIELEKRS